MTRPWPFDFAKKTFPQIQKVVKQVNWLLENGIKRGHMGTPERESHTLAVVWITCMWHFVWVSASHFDHMVLGPYLIYVRILPCVYTSLSQNRFQQRGLWVDLTSLLTLTLQGAFCLKDSDFENEKYVVSSLSGRGPASSLLIVLLLIFWFLSREWNQITHSQRVHLLLASKSA